MTELQQLMEEVKMLKDSVQQETEEKNKLEATITDKDVCLERAVADTDRLKAQLAEKEEQVGWVWSTGDTDFVCENNSNRKTIAK